MARTPSPKTTLDLPRAQATLDRIANEHPEFTSAEVIHTAAAELGYDASAHRTLASLIGVRLRRSPEQVAKDAEDAYIVATANLLRAQLLLAAATHMSKPVERMIRAALAAGLDRVAFAQAIEVLTPEQWADVVRLPATEPSKDGA